jgi:hypothetical protein
MKIRAILLAVLFCVPAIASAQGSTSGIDGTWDIVMNGFGGKITFGSGGGVLNMSGYPQEKIIDLSFSGSTIRFTRVSSFGPSGDQVFTGTVSGNNMKGTLTQAGIPGGIYQWNATRPGGAQDPIHHPGPVPPPRDFVTPPPDCNWESFTPDIRSFATQPGRVFPLRQGDFPAGNYMIFVAPTGKNGLDAPNLAKAFGPYTLRSEKRYKSWIHTSGKALGWEEESADLLRYGHPLPGFARIYFRNDVDGDEWYAICVLPAGGDPVPSGFVTPPPTCQWTPFPPDIRSHGDQSGRVSPVEPSNMRAGRYTIFVAPIGKNGLGAPNLARAFGPYTLQSEKRYKALIHTSGKALGWEEESADLLSYPHPLPGFTRIYARNNVDGDEWYAICAQWMGPTGGGVTGIDIIAGIWKNTDHIHRGCRDVQSFCKAYKLDLQFSKTADGALEGQLVGQSFVMVGELQGQTWDFTVTMNGSFHGKGSFVFSQDFRSFNGELTDVNGHHVVWTGSK